MTSPLPEGNPQRFAWTTFNVLTMRESTPPTRRYGTPGAALAAAPACTPNSGRCAAGLDTHPDRGRQVSTQSARHWICGAQWY